MPIRKKIAVLRARHDAAPPDAPDPISEDACRRVLLTDPGRQSVLNYWADCTDGHVDCEGSTLFPWVRIGPFTAEHIAEQSRVTRTRWLPWPSRPRSHCPARRRPSQASMGSLSSSGRARRYRIRPSERTTTRPWRCRTAEPPASDRATRCVRLRPVPTPSWSPNWAMCWACATARVCWGASGRCLMASSLSAPA